MNEQLFRITYYLDDETSVYDEFEALRRVDSISSALDVLMEVEGTSSSKHLIETRTSGNSLVLVLTQDVVTVKITDENNDDFTGEASVSVILDGVKTGRTEVKFIGVTSDDSIVVNNPETVLSKINTHEGTEFAPIGSTCIVNSNKKDYPQIVIKPIEGNIFLEEDMIAIPDEISSENVFGNASRLIPLGYVSANKLGFCLLFEGDNGLTFITYNENDSSTEETRIDNLLDVQIDSIGFDYDSETFALQTQNKVKNIYVSGLIPSSGQHIIKRVDIYPDSLFGPMEHTRALSTNFGGKVHPSSVLASIVVTNDKIFMGFSPRNRGTNFRVRGFNADIFTPGKERLDKNKDLLFAFEKNLFDIEEEGTFSLSETQYTRSYLPFNPLIPTESGIRYTDEGDWNRLIDFDRNRTVIEYPYPVFNSDTENKGSVQEMIAYAVKENLGDQFPSPDNLFAVMGHLGGIGTGGVIPNSPSRNLERRTLVLYNTGQLVVMDYEKNVVGYYTFAESDLNGGVVMYAKDVDVAPNHIKMVRTGDFNLPKELHGSNGFFRTLGISGGRVDVRTGGSYDVYPDNHTMRSRDFLMLWNGIQHTPETEMYIRISNIDDPNIQENIAVPGFGDIVPVCYFEPTFVDHACFRSAVPIDIDDTGVTEFDRHNLRVFSGKIMDSTDTKFLHLFSSPYSKIFLSTNNIVKGDGGVGENWEFNTGWSKNLLLDPAETAGEGCKIDARKYGDEGEIADVNKVALSHHGIYDSGDLLVTTMGYYGISQGKYQEDGNYYSFDPHVDLYNIVDLLGFEIEEGGEEDPVFPAESTWRYRVSFVYDGYQEGPLSSIFWEYQVPTGESNVIALNLKVRIAPELLNTFNMRIAKINVYRTEILSGVEQQLFSLVGSVNLTRRDSVIDEDGNLVFGIRDDRTSFGSFEAINGYSETLRNVSVMRECQAICQGYLFVGNCVVPGDNLKSIENIIIRSKPGMFSIFNYIEEFLMLPFTPIVMTSHQNKLFVFGENNFCVVDPQALAIEYSSELLGCREKDHLLTTEEALFVFYKGRVYLLSGSNANVISEPVEYPGSGSYGIREGVPTKLLYSQRRESLLVIQGTSGIVAAGTSILTYSFNLRTQIWVILSGMLTGALKGAYSDINAESVVVTLHRGRYASKRLFSSPNSLEGRVEISMPPDVSSSKVFLYGYDSHGDVEEIKAGGESIPEYSEQSRVLFEGGTIFFRFVNTVKNVTLYIRRLLPYAKGKE